MIVVIVMVLISICIFCECFTEDDRVIQETEKERIVQISCDNPSVLSEADVLVDTDTQVEYLVIRTKNGAAVTPLYEADGSLKVRK